jgi:hypothetical protein
VFALRMNSSVIVGAASKSYYENIDYFAIWEKAKQLNVEKLFLALRKLEMLIFNIELTEKNRIRMFVSCEPQVTYDKDPHMLHLCYYKNYSGSKKLNKCLEKNNAAYDWYDAGTAVIYLKD